MQRTISLATIALGVLCLSQQGQTLPTKGPELTRLGNHWSLTWRAEGDVLPLQQARTSANPRVTVPVYVRPGRWLAAEMRPDNSIEVPLEETDVLGLLPGMNILAVQTPGYQLRKIPFDAAPLFKADSDIREYATARQHAVGTDDTAPGTMKSDAFPALTFSPLPTSAGSTLPGGRIIPLEGKAQRIYVLLDARPAKLEDKLTVRSTDGSVVSRPPHIIGDMAWTSAPDSPTVAVLDLGELKPVEALEIEGESKVIAVTTLGSLRPGAYAALPLRARSFATGGSAILFSFDRPSLEGWEIQGSGWGTTDTVGEFFGRKGNSRYFADSKVVGGEPAMGTILSPPFTISGAKLTFLANGHGMKNYYALVDAKTGEELRRHPVPEKTGPFEKLSWDVSDLKGRKVRFKAVDADNRTAYAWLAFDEVTLEP